MALTAAHSEPSCSTTMPGRISLPLIFMIVLGLVRSRASPGIKPSSVGRELAAEPYGGAVLGGSVVVLAELIQEIVEQGIGEPLRAREQVPGGAVNGIGGQAATGEQDAGEPVLRHRGA